MPPPNLDRLVRELVAYVDQELLKLRNKVGTVTGTSGTKVVVTVDGASATLSRLASYTPTAGDQVFIDVSVQNWLVLGKIQP